MKHYTAQVKMSYYVTVEVEAENEHSARDQALRLAWREESRGRGCWGEEPEVIDLMEGVTND